MADRDAWDTEENRLQIAQRLRMIATKVEQGLVITEDYSLEPEWKGATPSGTITLKLSYRPKRDVR